MTNADRNRAMTDEELAEMIRDTIFARCPNAGEGCSGLISALKCEKCWLKWLKQEVTE